MSYGFKLINYFIHISIEFKDSPEVYSNNYKIVDLRDFQGTR